MAHPLANILNSLIKTDTRDPAQRNLASAGSGKKRTTIVGATVKSITQAQVDNQGLTTWGVLKQQPMTRSMVKQGPLFDCFVLAAVLALTLDDPYWCDDIIIPIDARTVIVQYYFRGEIVQITTSLEVSTSYNNPNDDDVRVELIEKTYGLLRKGISDYFGANWGNGLEAMQAFGRTVVSVQNRTPAYINTLRSQKKGLVFVTGVSPTKVVGRHAYCLASGSVCINPWDGSVDTPLDASTLATSSEIAAIYAGTLPSPKVLVKPPTPAPPPRKYVWTDYINLCNHYGTSHTKGEAGGDFNGDGFTNHADFTILANGWYEGVGNAPDEPKPVTPETPMPTAKITKTDHDAGAKAWDRVKLDFTATGGTASVTVTPTPPGAVMVDPVTNSAAFPMPNADATITLTVTAPDGTKATDTRVVKLITPSVTPTPTPTPTPAKIKFVTFDAEARTVTVVRTDSTTQVIA